MGLQESPSFDNLDKRKPQKKRLSQRALRRGLLVAILLLGTVLLIFGGTRLGSRADPEFGGVDGCFVDGVGNPVVADVIYGDQSRQSYADGCFFFETLPSGLGELTVQRGVDMWFFDVSVIAEQATGLGNLVLK